MRGVPLFLCCSLMAFLAPAWGNKDRIHLQRVTTLTLKQGKMTTGRRLSPMQQLICVGGSAGCNYGIQPHVIQCYNQGFDGYNMQWECKAELDPIYQLGKIQVSCEGYENTDDPYVLRGSCGLKYELDFTHKEFYQLHISYHLNTIWSGLVGLLVVLATLVFITYKACISCRRRIENTTHGAIGSQGSSLPPSNTGSGGQHKVFSTGVNTWVAFRHHRGRENDYASSCGSDHSTGCESGDSS